MRSLGDARMTAFINMLNSPGSKTAADLLPYVNVENWLKTLAFYATVTASDSPTMNYNNFFLIDSPEVANDFRDEFNQMFDSSKFRVSPGCLNRSWVTIRRNDGEIQSIGSFGLQLGSNFLEIAYPITL